MKQVNTLGGVVVWGYTAAFDPPAPMHPRCAKFKNKQFFLGIRTGNWDTRNIQWTDLTEAQRLHAAKRQSYALHTSGDSKENSSRMKRTRRRRLRRRRRW